MAENEENITQYKVVGYPDYIVTDGGKVFRTRYFKRSTKNVEVKPDTQDLVPLYEGKVRTFRCTLERLLTAAKEGLDPRDKKVEEIIKRNRLDALLPTVAQRVDAASSKKDKIAIIQKDIEQAMLSELQKGDAVNDGSRLLVSMAAMIFIEFTKAYNALNTADRMVAVEFSREGNERRTQSAELRNVLDLAKEMRSQFAQLGITYDDIQKRVSKDTQSETLFDKFEEVEESKEPIGKVLADDLQ